MKRDKYLLIFLFLLIFVFSFKDIGFVTEDDYEIALDIENNKWPIDSSLNEGMRFNLYITHFITLVFYKISNSNLINLIFHIISVLFFAYFISLLSQKQNKNRIIIVYLSLYFLFIQNHWEHSLIAAYPIIFFIGLIFIFSSFIIYWKYLQTNNQKFFYISIALFFIGLNYEVFIVYILIFAILHFYLKKTNSMKPLFLFLIPIILFVIIYIIVLNYFPHLYFQSDNIFAIKYAPLVLIVYSLSAFPAFNFLAYHKLLSINSDFLYGHNYNLFYILQNTKIEWIVKALIGIFLLYHCIYKKPYLTFNSKETKIIFIMGIAFTFIPNILLAFTTKYQNWVLSGSHYYITTSFAYFGMTLIIASLLIFINKKINKNKKMRVFLLTLIFLSIFIGSILTDYANYNITKTQLKSQIKWEMIDLFLDSEDFNELSINSQIYSPSLWNNIYHIEQKNDYWTRYFSTYSDKNLNIFKNKTNIKVGDYYFHYLPSYKDNNYILVFSRIDKIINEKLLSNNISIYSFHKNMNNIVYVTTLNNTKIKSSNNTYSNCHTGCKVVPSKIEDLALKRIPNELLNYPMQKLYINNINGENIYIEEIEFNYYE